MQAGTDQIAAVDDALRRPYALRFPAALEAEYERRLGAMRCRSLMLWHAIGLVFYNVFLVSDALLIPETYHLAVLVNLGIVTPLGVAFLLVLRLQPPPALREGLLAAMTLVGIAAMLFLTVASDSPTRGFNVYGAITIVLYTTMILRLAFAHSVVLVAGTLAMVVPVIHGIDAFPEQVVLSQDMLLAAVMIFALVASYNLEHERRQAFLLILRDRLRNADLDQLSRSDPLTGLANRRQFDRFLADWYDAPGAAPIALAMIDVDHFKGFNDSLGHMAGDDCLRGVAALVAREARSGIDLAVRFGGDEMALVMPGRDLDDAAAAVERIRRAVEAASLTYPAVGGGLGMISISVGVAAADRTDPDGATGLIAAADGALYLAKGAGRNRVRTAARAEHDLVAGLAGGRNGGPALSRAPAAGPASRPPPPLPALPRSAASPR